MRRTRQAQAGKHGDGAGFEGGLLGCSDCLSLGLIGR